MDPHPVQLTGAEFRAPRLGPVQCVGSAASRWRRLILRVQPQRLSGALLDWAGHNRYLGREWEVAPGPIELVPGGQNMLDRLPTKVAAGDSSQQRVAVGF